MGKRESAIELVRGELRRLTVEIDGLDARAAARLGINRTDLSCLDALGARGPLTPSELAKTTRLTSGGLSIALERLERAGFVERSPNPADRRSVIVDMTDEAKASAREVFGPLARHERLLLRRHSDEGLVAIGRFMADWADLLAGYLVTERPGADGDEPPGNAQTASTSRTDEVSTSDPSI